MIICISCTRTVVAVAAHTMLALFPDVGWGRVTLQKLKGSFNLPRVILVAASSPDNVQTSADQQIVLLNPFMEAHAVT